MAHPRNRAPGAGAKLRAGDSGLDRPQKLAIYAREGVEHARLVDPDAQTLEVPRRIVDPRAGYTADSS